MGLKVRTSRRHFLAAAGAGALSVGMPRRPLAAAKTVKVGISLSMSGPTASIGERVWRGASLYHKLNRDKLPGSVAIDVIIRDDAGSSDNVKRIAQELIVRDRVQILGGIALSPQAFTLAPLLDHAKIPLVVMNASTSSITQKSSYIVRVATTLWQTNYTIGAWAAKNGHKKACTLVADYAAGFDAEAAFKKAFTENGGEIVGAIRAPLAATDYLPYMETVRSSGADTLFMFVLAGRLNAATTAFESAGLKQMGLKLIGPGEIAMDDDIAAMGSQVLGITTAGIYFANNAIDSNRAFIAEWKKEYGAASIPNFMSVAGWDGMAAIYDLVRSTNGDFSPADAMKFFASWKTGNSPRGTVSIDPETRDIVQTIYINRVDLVDGKPANVMVDKVADVRDPWKALKIPE